MDISILHFVIASFSYHSTSSVVSSLKRLQNQALSRKQTQSNIITITKPTTNTNVNEMKRFNSI